MSNITKCDKRQSGLFLFQRRLDNKYTIKRESKTTGGDQVKNEQQSDRGHDRRTRYGNDDVRCYMIYNEKKVEMLRQRYPEGTRTAPPCCNGHIAGQRCHSHCRVRRDRAHFCGHKGTVPPALVGRTA